MKCVYSIIPIKNMIILNRKEWGKSMTERERERERERTGKE